MKIRTVGILSLAAAVALVVPASNAQRLRIVPYPNTDFIFNDLKIYITNTQDECVRGCLDNSECVAFTYKSSGMCYLKKGVRTLQRSTFATSGYIASRGMPPQPLPDAQPGPVGPQPNMPMAGSGGLPPAGAVPATGSLRWVPGGTGMAVPADAVIGGSEDGIPLPVCRATYAGGLYPGKLVKDNCNISYDSREIYTHGFEILAGTGAHWGAPQPGFQGAFVAGGENGGPLYLCQAEYRGNLHPGKIYDGKCDISYAGREIPVASFQVLYTGP